LLKSALYYKIKIKDNKNKLYYYQNYY